jgi:hypothetical protein
MLVKFTLGLSYSICLAGHNNNKNIERVAKLHKSSLGEPILQKYCNDYLSCLTLETGEILKFLF